MSTELLEPTEQAAQIDIDRTKLEISATRSRTRSDAGTGLSHDDGGLHLRT